MTTPTGETPTSQLYLYDALLPGGAKTNEANDELGRLIQNNKFLMCSAAVATLYAQAYERGHSSGEAEVNSIFRGIVNDFIAVSKYFLLTSIAQDHHLLWVQDSRCPEAYPFCGKESAYIIVSQHDYYTNPDSCDYHARHGFAWIDKLQTQYVHAHLMV